MSKTRNIVTRAVDDELVQDIINRRIEQLLDQRIDEHSHQRPAPYRDVYAALEEFARQSVCLSLVTVPTSSAPDFCDPKWKEQFTLDTLRDLETKQLDVVVSKLSLHLATKFPKVVGERANEELSGYWGIATQASMVARMIWRKLKPAYLDMTQAEIFEDLIKSGQAYDKISFSHSFGQFATGRLN